jgi:hypothetical protein
MQIRFVAAASALAVAAAAGLMAASQAQSTAPSATWTAPRTADGQPDLQGVWDYRTITPLERPAEFASKEFFTAEEAQAFEQDENRRQNRDLIDDEQGGLNYPPGGVVPYNEFWYDRGDKLAGLRTSLIVDPPNGRLPPWTAEGKQYADRRAEERRNDQLGRPKADTWEDRPLQERCILGLNAGPPMTPGAYNNNVQLLQTPGYVVIVNEMVHSARVVPLDGRPHGNIRMWKGDSRGRWEGDTLVVETINFKSGTNVPGTTANTKLTERFTRTGPNTLEYQFTVDDPTMWTRPWTAVVPMAKSDQPIYEYACHEANYGIAGILGGARAAEKAQDSAKR